MLGFLESVKSGRQPLAPTEEEALQLLPRSTIGDIRLRRIIKDDLRSIFLSPDISNKWKSVEGELTEVIQIEDMNVRPPTVAAFAKFGLTCRLYLRQHEQ
jgi:hypothetical protein